MDNQGSMNLMSMKECSPMMAFAVYVVVSGITLFMTRNNMKKNGNSEVLDQLYALYSWHELKYIIVIGVILYGLCQYKQDTLAWISLTLPVLYLIFKNIYVFSHIFSAQQSPPKMEPEPKKNDSKKMFQQELIKQQEDIQKQQIQQQRLQQQKLQEQVQSHYQQPVNKDIGGLSPPLNSYDPSHGNMALF